MLFTIIIENGKKFGSKSSLNGWTWRELPDIIRDRPYVEFSNSTGVDILLDILKAASIDRPIIVPPLAGDCLYSVPADGFNITLYSSGSTGGLKKPVTLGEGMIMANARNSIEAHGLGHHDRVLTVCSMNHTGGINAQTIPALVAGAHVVVRQFEPFTFLNTLNSHRTTVTHLVPRMMDALIKIGSRKTLPHLRLVVCGSDCIKREYARWWSDHKVPFMINYGLTQAGPITVNHIFNPGDDLSVFERGVPLGTKRWCQTRIVGNELELCGDSTIVDGWLATDDCVEEWGGWLLYQGRKSAGCKIIPKSY